MSVSIRNYRKVSRDYLLKIIEKQKHGSTSYPISLYEKNLEQELEKVGFFSKNKKVVGWRQEICPKTFKCVYSPIHEYED